MTNLPDQTRQTRPQELMDNLGIKKAAYYDRLNFLQITTHKDEERRAYLDENQVDMMIKLHEYIKIHGKMEGFNYYQEESSLAVKEENGISHQEENGITATEDIYVKPEEPTDQFDVNGLVREAAELKAREVAMPHLVKRALADKMEESDLPTDLQEKVGLAREAANPKFTPQQVAEQLLAQLRA